MDLVQTFGSIVTGEAKKNPDAAEKILLTGYRLQQLKNKALPDKGVPKSGQFAAQVVMQGVIDALAKPQNAVMTSIFVPGELFTAAGLAPYSVETMSCFMAASHCEQASLAQADREGFPETMCSYHRVFLGTALTGMLPRPACVMYTNLACDGNMMTFPYMKEKYDIPGFYIDVPYVKDEGAVKYVAAQLREARTFLEDSTHRHISDNALAAAVARSNAAADAYSAQLALRSTHNPPTTLTTELYGIFMCMILAGSENALKYARQLLEDVKNTPEKTDDIGIVWMHIMPFLQKPVIEVFNHSDDVHIKACDFVYSGFMHMKSEDPFEAMAEKLVYSVYNGSVKERILRAIEVTRQTGADGVILFAHWGCKSTTVASGLVKAELEAAGIPVLVLDGDGCNPANTSDGQVSTRLQAFMEMLKERKAEKSI